jgi:hypothetical protein
VSVHEEIELFGVASQLAGCRHMPDSLPAAGVVICSSAPFDAAVDHGRAARLGRRLAQAGVAVQRFHPLGTPADRDPAEICFASLVDDAWQAVALLRDRCGVERLGFVGARLGALVAARVARPLDGAPLALWEPAVDPRTVVEQAAEARLVRQRAGVASWAGGPSIDVFDTPLGAELSDGTLVGGLLDEIGDRPRPLLVAQTADGDALRADYDTLVIRARARELTVDAACYPCDGQRDGVPVPIAAADALVDDTAAWLVAHLQASGEAGPGGPPPGADVQPRERP